MGVRPLNVNPASVKSHTDTVVVRTYTVVHGGGGKRRVSDLHGQLIVLGGLKC